MLDEEVCKTKGLALALPRGTRRARRASTDATATTRHDSPASPEWDNGLSFGREYPTRLRADLRVNKHVLVELKAAEAFHPAHQAQLRTYLRWGAAPLGYLINFHAPRLKDGLWRYVNPRVL